MTPEDQRFLDMTSTSQKTRAALEKMRGSKSADSIPAIYRDFLKSHPMAALRELVRREDLDGLNVFLAAGWCSPEQCQHTLEEYPDTDLRLRILLLHPEFARMPEPHQTSESRDSIIARYQFRAGAAYPPLRETVLSMDRIPDRSVNGIAADGLAVYYNPDAPAPEYEDFQHLLIHCLFLHMLVPKKAVLPLWDLACDMAAEFLRTELFPCRGGTETQLVITDALPQGGNPRDPAQIYRSLMELFEEDLEPLRRKCLRDDHRYWYRAPNRPERKKPIPAEAGEPGGGQGGTDPLEERQKELQEKLPVRWQRIAEAMQKSVSQIPRHGLTPGSREDRQVRHAAGKYDFTRYLRRFSVLEEEMQLDLDSFDYIPYYYGFQMFGNMPMIEPLEYTESHKVDELVIAIDTSGSCSRDTVSRFLAEIQRILMDRENFFRKMNIHIIQCDAIVQEHVKITTLEDWEEYRRKLTIKGRGGTNFRPVFQLVEKLRASGELKNLKGLLYFTDGDGVYPKKRTAYETAFVFTEPRALQFSIPDWIIRLVLDPIPPDELTSSEDTGRRSP